MLNKWKKLEKKIVETREQKRERRDTKNYVVWP